MRTEDIVLEALVNWWKDQEWTRVVEDEFDIGVKIDGSYYDLRDLAHEITFELERNS